jgi:hypothetical protein
MNQRVGKSARHIIAHCGLPWSAACLSFHETAQPAHGKRDASSPADLSHGDQLGRWRVYEEFLGPLLAGSGPLGS